MSIYQTPLQFGYFFALLFAVLFWVRSWQAERLSDRLLGWVLLMLANEIQDYTFGFSGINILWEDFNGFPRYTHLAFAPTIYFYLKAQTNRAFRLNWRNYLHYLPYAMYVLGSLVLFLRGSESVLAWQSSVGGQALGYFITLAIWTSYVYYFYHSLKLYRAYRAWTETQFSDTEIIGFKWLRNFIYLIIAGEVFKWGWNIADTFLDLDYYQDWWWHLFTVGIICYVAVRGYAQVQHAKLAFEAQIPPAEPTVVEPIGAEPVTQQPDYAAWKRRIEELMVGQRLYLEPELSLSELAIKLKTNASVLSAVINNGYGKNFNDFVNEYRVSEVKQQLTRPENAHLTLLGIALDCGFNSKATFNRSFKKFTGLSPKEYTDKLSTPSPNP